MVPTALSYQRTHYCTKTICYAILPSRYCEDLRKFFDNLTKCLQILTKCSVFCIGSVQFRATGEVREVADERRADDGLRTRDLQLGKLALYQLSYVRTGGYFSTL